MKPPKLSAIAFVQIAAVAGACSVTTGVAILAGAGFAFVCAGAFLLAFSATLFRGLNG